MTSTSALNQLEAEQANSHKAFVFPASFAQRRLWFLDQLIPGDPTYTVPGAVEIEGPLDVEALEKSLQEVVRRHESLRTRFDGNRGEPQQVIDSEAALNMQFLDLRSIPEHERQAQADQIAREEAKKPFDLRRSPLLRVTLMCLAEQRHRLVLTTHHIISDGWSVGILIRELAVLYNAFTQGRPSPLPELPIQYVDYTAWQQEQLVGESLQRHLDYWKQQLDGVQTELDLVTDRPHRQGSANQGAQYYFDLDAALTRDLRRFGQEQGVTLYMVLLAGYQALLYRHTGQQELLVGSPVAGRTRTEIQGLIGFFVNTIVTKATFTANITFRQLLKLAKDTTLDAYAHQDIPFEKLVEELSPQRNLGRTPLFQTMFSLQNESMLGMKLGSANLRLMDIDLGTAKFELTFALTEFGDVIKASFEYGSALFDRATIAHLAERFTFLIRELLTDPDRPISQAPLVPEQEMARLAAGWTATSVSAVEVDRGFLSRLAEHAHSETKLAIVSSGQRITYAVLDERALQLAKRLRTCGVAPAARVGVCVANMIDRIVALLGVLKAGAVAVPVDVEEPIPRMQLVFKDANAEWTISDTSCEERVQQTGARILRVDGTDDPVTLAPKSTERSNIRDGEAIVLYQSDPSGKPKGVVVPHSALLPRTFANTAAILETDRIGMNVTRCGEDGALLELLRCLALGATLVDLGDRHTPRKLATTLRDESVTVLHPQTEELVRLAREFNWSLKTLRMVVLSDDHGIELEQLRQTLLPEVLNRVYRARGNNETFGWWALYPLAGDDNEITAHLAAGTRLCLLDSQQQPMPDNIVGELYIGGNCFGLGEQDLPENEIPEFLYHSVKESDPNMYRSGEFGWRRSDGSLRFCGRRDGRGWISGVRVETGEIEFALQQYAGLQDVAVLVADTGLRAFVVVGDGVEFNVEAVQTWLRERLPEVMVPRKFDRVERIPRDPNGFVHRKALKSLANELDMLADKPVYAAPRNEIEQKLVTIWEQTLGLARVGIHDDFFRIGGHSLLATRVIARITDELGVAVPLSQLFTTSTIAQLADLVAHSPATKAVVPIKRLARPVAVP
jgi:non-ribosomal peptide synthetase component F/acyl carrier protein